jgi:hypothetical protein
MEQVDLKRRKIGYLAHDDIPQQRKDKSSSDFDRLRESKVNEIAF